MRRWVVILPLMVAACGGGDGEPSPNPAIADVINPEPAAGNTVIRLFSKPFAGQYPLLNFFDHDRPVAPDDSNGYQLNWRGIRAYPGKDIDGYDGHRGIDWKLPADTPVLAVTSGEVLFAGNINFACFLDASQPSENPSVFLQFVAPDGMTYWVLYQHLNRIDVTTGDQVVEGQQLGLSGNKGCVGKGNIPHLHFQMARVTGATSNVNVLVDPYGWEGPTPDPWSVSSPEKTSIWFWKQGQAPDMYIRR